MVTFKNMDYLANSIISHLKSIAFYKEVFPIKNLFRQIPNIIFNSSFFPLTVNLLVSDQCNFFCKMCSWREPLSTKNYDKVTILNTSDINNFISRIKKYCPLIHIGGGEPFIRRDLLEIITIIKNNKLRCLISTNGFLINEDIIDKIVELKIDALIFSIYGLEDTHDAITMVKGSFNKTFTNLKSILKKRTKHTKVFVSTLPLPENINELKQLVNNLYVLGVDGVKIEQLNFITFKECEQSINNMGRFNLSPSIFIQDNYFDKKFVKGLINIYKNIHNTFGNFVYLKPYLNESQLINWYSAVPHRLSRCIFITHSVFVNSNGDVMPCQFFRDCVLGNITEDSLESVWRSRQYETLRRNISRIKPLACLRCCKN